MSSLLEEVAQKFGVKVKRDRGGPYVKIPGPDHSGKDDSLKVRLDDKGELLVHSFSGDKWEGAKDWLREQMDMPAWLSNGKKKNGNGKSGDGGTLVAEYVYATHDNKPYLKVKKYVDDHGKKTFRQHHWDGKDWPTGKPAGPKIPYRLPELINSQISIPVYFVEGEKDALALGEIGLISTTASEGANAKWDDALTEYFAGRTVIIIPDADAPGRQHAQKVAKALSGTAVEIRILELYPDRDDGSDASDYLKGDPTGAQLTLAKIRKQTKEWDPEEAKRQEDEQLDEIAKLKGIDQIKAKKELAKHLGLTGKELDKVLNEKDTSAQPEHWDVKPWAEPVLTEWLLDRLSDFYTARAILPEHAAEAMALWCLHAWVHEAASASAFLQFVSPVPECGKTTAMEAMQWTVPRGIMATNISPSVFYRFIDRDHPTLIIDEVETYAKREDVRGILDGSHTRAGSRTIRNVGDNHEPKWFSTWGPKVIGGLGKLAATIRSRCITIHMKRKKKTEKIIKLRGRDTDEFKALRSQACRWAADNFDTLKEAQPVLPRGLTDRGEDCWEPLFAIAELAGPEWTAKSHAAALEFNGSHDVADDDLGVQLLAAIKDLIETTRGTASVDGVFSEAIVKHLHQDTTGPWLAYGKMQKEITARQVGDLLRPYGIKPKQIRQGATSKKGYEFASFKGAFDAYLATPSISSETPKQTNSDKHLEPISSETPIENVSDENAGKSLNEKTCFGVSDQKQGTPPIRAVCRFCTGPADGSEVTCSVAGVLVSLHEKCVDGWMEAAKTMPPDEMLQTYR
jgi:putative DNA primase/helicase